MRIFLAGLAGGLAMFVWVSIAHMATPLAFTGFSKMDNQTAVLDGFTKGLGNKAGLYYFPWTEPGDPKAMEKEAALVKTTPHGILIYHPPGGSADMTPMLIHEFLKEVAQALIAAFLLSFAALTGYIARTGFVTLIGIFAALGTDTSYWIWYGFPAAYTAAQITISVVGALAAGLVIAAIVRPKT